MRILVTGGTGYIGSHTIVELLNNNYDVVCIDNFSNSKRKVLDSIKTITNKDIKFYEGDVCNKVLLDSIFKENKIDAVIHFAGYKAVGESVEQPLKYYNNNLNSTLSLLEIMGKNNCKNLVFSSSATVYGKPKSLPIKEDFSLSTTNPYGTTKLMIERILKDLYKSDDSWNINILRYFNPVGAHESGLIGEDPNGIPNNLMPYIVGVGTGRFEYLRVYGNDYETKDGTGVRDYIHVVDLAKGHIKAIEHLKGLGIYNLGSGHGYSVLEMAKTFAEINNVAVPCKFFPRRDGDIAECYADCSKAKQELGFETTKTIEDMCRDAYNYVKNQNN